LCFAQSQRVGHPQEIKLATFLIETFVITPLNDELCYEKGENITHFAIEHRQKTYSKSLSEKGMARARLLPRT
jgi:hypothetical protein